MITGKILHILRSTICKLHQFSKHKINRMCLWTQKCALENLARKFSHNGNGRIFVARTIIFLSNKCDARNS